MLFCHRWLLLCFKREFPEAEALRIWEACWAHYQVSQAGALGPGLPPHPARRAASVQLRTGSGVPAPTTPACRDHTSAPHQPTAFPSHPLSPVPWGWFQAYSSPPK